MNPTSRSFPHWVDSIGPTTLFSTLAETLDGAALYSIDGAGRILSWSPGAERLLGFSAAQVLDRPGETVLRCRGCGGLGALIERGRLDHEPTEVERADGSTLRVRRSARAFFDAGGAFAGAVAILWPEGTGHAADCAADGAARVDTFHGLITRDPTMKQAIQIVRNVAETDTTVLIRGESGTGKELVARALHEESRRRGRAFLAINCAALNPSLLESELFGHVRGAFTGALKDHAGLFKRADGGTLFLDEVAELPLELQAKLLRVLQEKNFLPVGGDRAVSVDVRIVAATHRSLREETKAGRFREDLMYRLRVVPIFLPPLRTRREDIELLLRHFIERHNALGPRRVLNIAPETLRLLLAYRWPGNIRELQNVVQYAFAVGRGETLVPEELPPEFQGAGLDEADFAAENTPAAGVAAKTAGPGFGAGLDEAARVRAALEHCGGKIDAAAALLGMSRATFWRKRKKYGA